MSLEYQNSILWRGEDPNKKPFKPTYDPGAKVVRYFPGKAPAWARDNKPDDDPDSAGLGKGRGKQPNNTKAASRIGFSNAAEKTVEKPAKKRSRDRDRDNERGDRERGDRERGDREKGKDRDRRRVISEPAVIVEDAAVGRLKRLAAAASQGSEHRTERLLRHRQLHEAQVVDEAPNRSEDEAEVKAEEKPVSISNWRERQAPRDEVKEEDDVKGDVVKDELDDEDEKAAKMKDDDEKDEKKEEFKIEASLKAKEMIDSEFKDQKNDTERRLKLMQLEAEERADDQRREAARDAARRRRQEEEAALREAAALAPQEDEADAEEDESSEEESGPDDDGGVAMMKPVFVSKTGRDTVREREALAAEQEKEKEKKAEREQERKVESKEFLIDVIKHDDDMEREGANENDGSDIELIDDDDEKNEAEEYELWKIRELKRIKRDKEERLERQREIDWIQKRRGMTDQEREEDDKKLDGNSNSKEDSKAFNFLQKYYHRGGFFQDKARTGEEPLYLRDYHEPTEEEKFDKKLLPAAMQLRRGQFGKKGQVKHTHLTAVDTTDMTAAWAQSGAKPIQKYQERMASASGVNNFERPNVSSSKNT